MSLYFGRISPPSSIENENLTKNFFQNVEIQIIYNLKTHQTVYDT